MTGELDSKGLFAGLYVIEIETDLKDSAGLPIAPQSTRLEFELRARRGDDDVELLRREGLKALDAGRLGEAEVNAAALEKLHPKSLAVLTLRAQIAEAQGQRRQAVALYSRALETLDRNQDDRLRSGYSERDEQLMGLRATLKRLGAN